MSGIVYQLLRPGAYLMIEHEAKWKFDWLVPLIFTAASLPLFLFFSEHINVFGGGGFISTSLSFIQILPGFFIAALAAIATFNRVDVDRHMPEPTPKIDIRIRGERNTIALTRRRFLCMLFAFLTAESMLLAGASMFSITFSEGIKRTLPGFYHEYFVGMFLLVYLFIFWQMLIATLLGLYYLGDRLHQPDGNVASSMSSVAEEGELES